MKEIKNEGKGSDQLLQWSHDPFAQSPALNQLSNTVSYKMVWIEECEAPECEIPEVGPCDTIASIFSVISPDLPLKPKSFRVKGNTQIRALGYGMN